MTQNGDNQVPIPVSTILMCLICPPIGAVLLWWDMKANMDAKYAAALRHANRPYWRRFL